MKIKFLSLAVITALSIGFTGCSSTGYQIADHNYKRYYIPSECESYKYRKSNVDELHCVHNGQRTGVILKPVSNK